MAKFSHLIKQENIRHEMFAKNITYDKLAELLRQKEIKCQSKMTVYNFINGEVEPKIRMMNAIAEILGKPVSHFFNIIT